MTRLSFIFLFILALATAHRCAADAIPTLNDILNASQLDVRSSAHMPTTTDAQVYEVQADSPLRQAFRTGPNAARLSKIAIWFSGWSESWTPEKSLVLRLYAGQDFTKVLAEAREPFSRRAWEAAVHIFTVDTPVAPNTAYTFELTTSGGRSLVGAAAAQPPFDGDVGPLTSNGQVLEGALWFETSVKHRANLDMLYAEVFSHFDLQRPDLRAVRDAVGARDWDKAKREIVTHFECRSDLMGAPTPNAAAPIGQTSQTVKDADLVVQHKFRAAGEIVDLGPRWNHLAYWPSRGGVGLTRSGVRGLLATAYSQTHDEKYAKAWDAMLRFQFEDLPSPLRAGVIEPDADDISPVGQPGIGGGSMWSSLSIAARMSHGFSYYRAFRGSPNFSLDTRFAFIVNLAEMSDVLERMKGGGNWEAQNTTSLLEFGRSFPEFRRAAAWQSRGFAGALQNCLDNTFPDGALREATTNYHALSLNRYLGVLEAAGKQPTASQAIPAIVRDRVQKMCDYMLYSTMPNGELPAWGDTNPPLDASNLLTRGADLFARPDMRWVATHGKSGTPPSTTSTAFMDSGYYLMRSSWQPDASFMAIHNGRSSAHGHSDANSLVLTAFGAQMLVDPGVYIYGTPESQLLSRSVSHNTVTMDDLNTANDQGEAHWTSGWWTDIYDGANAGYEVRSGGDAAARHRRIVVFLKPSLFFVVDAALGSRPHDWTLRHHFAPGALTTSPDGKSITFRPGDDAAYAGHSHGGIRLWSAAQESAHLTTALGLAAGGWERKIEAPVAISSVFQSDAALWATLIEPFGTSPSALSWDVRQDEQGIAMAYQENHGSRRFLLVRTEAEAPMPDSWANTTAFSTDAHVAAFEQRPAGKHDPEYRRLALHEGSLFLEPGSSAPAIVRSDQPVDLLEVTWKGDTLAVHQVGGAGTVLKTFGAHKLLLNGKVFPISAGLQYIRLPEPRRT